MSRMSDKCPDYNRRYYVVSHTEWDQKLARACEQEKLRSIRCQYFPHCCEAEASAHRYHIVADSGLEVPCMAGTTGNWPVRTAGSAVRMHFRKDSQNPENFLRFSAPFS
jgi:hypothetical protein